MLVSCCLIPWRKTEGIFFPCLGVTQAVQLIFAAVLSLQQVTTQYWPPFPESHQKMAPLRATSTFSALLFAIKEMVLCVTHIFDYSDELLTLNQIRFHISAPFYVLTLTLHFKSTLYLPSDVFFLQNNYKFLCNIQLNRSIYMYCSQAIVKPFTAGSPETFSTPWLLWARNRMPGITELHWHCAPCISNSAK